MAIQIRRGTNAQWETNKSNIVAGEPAVATDSKRAFIGTSNGHYMELANIESVAPAFSTSTTYHTGDVVTYQGLMYVALTETSGYFNGADWEQMSIGNMLSRFNEHLYDGYETATIEDTPLATFSDGAGDIAVKDLQVSIKAVQNLNGYDHPWTMGAGKNKLINNVTETITQSKCTMTPNGDGSFTVDVTSAYTATNIFVANTDFADGGTTATQNDSKKHIPNGTYKVVFDDTDGSSTFRVQVIGTNDTSPSTSSVSVIANTHDGTFTVDDTYAYNWIRLTTVTGLAVGTYTFKAMIIPSTETDTSYAPPQNICPIVGWDSVKTYVSGKNILSTQNVANGSYGGISVTHNADGSLTLNGTASASTMVLGNISTGLYSPSASQNDGTKHIPNGTWVASTGLSSNIGVALQMYGTNEKSGLGDLHSLAGSVSTTSARFTVDDTYRYNYARLRVNAGTYNNVTVYPWIYSVDNWQDPYEKGKINTYTSSLGSTRYGGVLDVTTGKLTVTHNLVDIGTKNITKLSSGSYFVITNVSDRKYGSNSDGIVGISSGYEFYGNGSSSTLTSNLQNGQFGYYATSVSIMLRNDGYTDANVFKTAMSGVYICYELDTPISTFISPTQVKTHYHDNNLWADCGDVEVLVYRITRH